MNLNSVKKHHFASVLPQLLSTHLTSSFNIRLVQIWPRTFPLCNIDQLTDINHDWLWLIKELGKREGQ